MKNFNDSAKLAVKTSFVYLVIRLCTSQVKRAYMDQVNLSAQGFYRTPDLSFTWSTAKGSMYHYFAYGASASEIEVDTLTGDFTILRSDLIMDVGDSLNPAIDIGQVFIHGG